ncbi:glucokinase [Beijerinckia indica]|uniref:Glucokinase n=1 Tax=Beijerinckia indica subsp. indica (strain ATCC 9039 / DSM 1715 / NCIMB 8712) TaxID=395963 RepID=B2IKK3_BEII9|nr:glucokinase [Beijerinckia indica]ACB96483.1 Glucokinase [Beijerinckia indica subsp. indica ATCC 9039]
MHFPFPHLLADIGGTNVRFAIVDRPGGELRTGFAGKTGAFFNFEAALAVALEDFAVQPRSLIACAAGPVQNRCVQMTNAHWRIDGAAVAPLFGLEQGLLLNDFEAQAYSLAVLRPDLIHPIGAQGEKLAGAQVILGPGTGLGVAALVMVKDAYYALVSEAGHVDFGPASDEEAALWPYIDREPLGRISAESLLSGPGLLRLHRARLTMVKHPPEKAIQDVGVLIEQAHKNEVGEEAATVRLFLSLLARFSSDMAVTFVSRGGVTFAGGILPRLIDFLDVATFRTHFENKPPHKAWVSQIPTRLIMDEAALFQGLAAIGAKPELYLINYAKRAWC